MDVMHAHHVRLGSNSGIGLKPSDYRALPLCSFCHDELHQHGEADFWTQHAIMPEAEIAKYMIMYTASIGLFSAGILQIIEREIMSKS